MNSSWGGARYLKMARRLLESGRLPGLLRAVADKGERNARFARVRDDLNLLLLCARVAQARGDSASTLHWCDQALTRRPGDLSALVTKATAIREMQRRGALVANLVPEEELAAVEEEGPALGLVGDGKRE